MDLTQESGWWYSSITTGDHYTDSCFYKGDREIYDLWPLFIDSQWTNRHICSLVHHLQGQESTVRKSQVLIAVAVLHSHDVLQFTRWVSTFYTLTLKWARTGKVQSGTNSEHVFPVHLFSIQIELRPTLPAAIEKTAVSADSTSEMLIYIRHGTSTPQCKSAEKLNEAESNAPSPQLCQISGLPDQRIAAFGTSDQKTDSLKKNKCAWPFACENRIEKKKTLWPAFKI